MKIRLVWWWWLGGGGVLSLRHRCVEICKNSRATEARSPVLALQIFFVPVSALGKRWLAFLARATAPFSSVCKRTRWAFISALGQGRVRQSCLKENERKKVWGLHKLRQKKKSFSFLFLPSFFPYLNCEPSLLNLWVTPLLFIPTHKSLSCPESQCDLIGTSQAFDWKAATPPPSYPTPFSNFFFHFSSPPPPSPYVLSLLFQSLPFNYWGVRPALLFRGAAWWLHWGSP